MKNRLWLLPILTSIFIITGCSDSTTNEEKDSLSGKEKIEQVQSEKKSEEQKAIKTSKEEEKKTQLLATDKKITTI